MEHFMDLYTIIAGLLILAVVSISILAIKDRAFSKPCPACRERVKSAARKCRFCGHLFSVAAALFFLLISVVPVFSSQAYDEQLKKRVSSVWKKPEGSDGFSATVRFALDRAGRLTERAYLVLLVAWASMNLCWKHSGGQPHFLRCPRRLPLTIPPLSN